MRDSINLEASYSLLGKTPGHEIHRFSHREYGWIELLMVHKDAALAFSVIAEIEKQVEISLLLNELYYCSCGTFPFPEHPEWDAVPPEEQIKGIVSHMCRPNYSIYNTHHDVETVSGISVQNV